MKTIANKLGRFSLIIPVIFLVGLTYVLSTVVDHPPSLLRLCVCTIIWILGSIGIGALTHDLMEELNNKTK